MFPLRPLVKSVASDGIVGVTSMIGAEMRVRSQNFPHLMANNQIRFKFSNIGFDDLDRTRIYGYFEAGLGLNMKFLIVFNVHAAFE